MLLCWKNSRLSDKGILVKVIMSGKCFIKRFTLFDMILNMIVHLKLYILPVSF